MYDFHVFGKSPRPAGCGAQVHNVEVDTSRRRVEESTLRIKTFGTFLLPLLWLTITTQSRGQSASQAPTSVPASVATAPSTPSQTKSYGLISVPEIMPGILAGYLPPTALPNSLALVPPAPTPGTAVYACKALRVGGRQPAMPIFRSHMQRKPSPAPWAFRSTIPKHRISTCCYVGPSPTLLSPPMPPKITTTAPVRSWKTTIPPALRTTKRS
jgi:hypothetical protein